MIKVDKSSCMMRYIAPDNARKYILIIKFLEVKHRQETKSKF